MTEENHNSFVCCLCEKILPREKWYGQSYIFNTGSGTLRQGARHFIGFEDFKTLCDSDGWSVQGDVCIDCMDPKIKCDNCNRFYRKSEMQWVRTSSGKASEMDWSQLFPQMCNKCWNKMVRKMRFKSKLRTIKTKIGRVLHLSKPEKEGKGITLTISSGREELPLTFQRFRSKEDIRKELEKGYRG